MIGGPITLDGAPTTVVGVLPPSFDFGGTFAPGRPADLFLPFPLSPETNRRGNTLAVIGRLKPGIDVTTAAVETATVVDRISRTAPDVEPGRRRNAFRPNLSPLQDRISGRFHGMLAVLAAAVGFLMLLVSANISNLVLARALARHKEMALRMALGAAASRVISTVTADSFRSISAGLALGWALAFAFNLHLGSGGFDGWAFAGVPAVLLAVAWLACWLPARRAARENPMTLLKQETT